MYSVRCENMTYEKHKIKDILQYFNFAAIPGLHFLQFYKNRESWQNHS